MTDAATLNSAFMGRISDYMSVKAPKNDVPPTGRIARPLILVPANLDGTGLPFIGECQTSLSRRAVAIGWVTAAASGAALIATFSWRVRGRRRRSPRASAAAAAEHPSEATAPVTTSAVQTWSTGHRAFWLGNRRGAAFELLAESRYTRGRAHAACTRRLLRVTNDGNVRLYAIGQRIEPRVDGKTVTVSVDDEPAKTERWSDSTIASRLCVDGAMPRDGCLANTLDLATLRTMPTTSWPSFTSPDLANDRACRAGVRLEEIGSAPWRIGAPRARGSSPSRL